MVASGDERTVFTRLWVEHMAAVRAFAWRRCPSEMVDDVVNETFVVAWRNLAVVPEQARPWLLGCARRVIHTRLRSRDRYLALQRRAGDEAGVQVFSGLDDQVVDRALMVRAWARLSEDDREALALTCWDGLDAAQAAQTLCCTPLAFRARVSRARRRLIALLDAEMADIPTTPQNEQEAPECAIAMP